MAESIPDLTNANASTFKANIGKTVSIQGKLQNGKVGLPVSNGTRKVSFRVVPDVPPGGFAYPKAWMDLIGHQVRVTGELRFQGFDHSHDGAESQSVVDYYFMVLQKAKIEKVAALGSDAELPAAGKGSIQADRPVEESKRPTPTPPPPAASK